MDAKVKIIISICLVFVITFISFLPSLKNGFTNWDDGKFIIENIMVQNLSWQNIKKMFTSFYSGLYQPLVFLSYAIEHHFFQYNPFYYHLTNLFLHLINSTLVFWLIFILSRQISVSIIAAILFGVHPLHVESVAWVTERKDVLYTIFFLGSIICYLYYRKKQIASSLTPRDDIFYYLSLFLFVLSLLAKPMAVTLPFVLVICDYLINPNKLTQAKACDYQVAATFRLREKGIFYAIKLCNYNFLNLKEKIPFFILSFEFIVITIFGVSKAQALQQAPVIPFFYYIFTSSYGFVFYLAKTILPVNLSCFYPYPDNIDKILPFSFIISPVLIIILTALVILSKKYTKKIVFGCLFFSITILPVIQLIPSSKTITADRYVYVPLIGLFYIFAEGFLWLYNKNKQKILKISLLTILASVIVILSISTWQRSKVWKDSITLWSDVLKNYPNLELAYNNRGIAYSYIKKYDKAIYDFNQALRIKPNYSVIYYNRGNVYLTIREYDKAIFNYNQALKNNPNYAKVYNNRGLAYFKKGKYNKALEDVKRSQSLGYQVSPKFLEDIRKFTGRLK